MQRLTLALAPFRDAGHEEDPDERVARKSAITAEQLSELELGLTVLWNSARRWMNQRSKASLIADLSELDTFLLHLLVYRDRPLRAADLTFALSIDDMHLVSYSLKKLVRLKAVTTARLGKEIVYSATDPGRQHYAEYLQDRQRYLEPALKYLAADDLDVERLKEVFRALSGVYEQAARAAASSKGG